MEAARRPDRGRRGATELSPFHEIDRTNIVTLPTSIGKVRTLRRLYRYGSKLRRLPRELGDLAESTVSTRALYGNFKFRPPFPALAPRDEPSATGSGSRAGSPRTCCRCSSTRARRRASTSCFRRPTATS